MRPLYYDRHGRPLTLMEWAPLLENKEYLLVARVDERRDDGSHVVISTVWLGLDHQIGDGPPLIFETMIFIDGERDHPFDQSQWRWSTEPEALEAHNLIAVAYRENKDPHVFIEAWREQKRKEALQ